MSRKKEFGEVVDTEALRQPEVYVRDPATGVLIAAAGSSRDQGPAAAMLGEVLRDERTGQLKRLPPKRVIEKLRRELDGESREVGVVMSPVRSMYRAGTLEEELYLAAVGFKRAFDHGGLYGLKATDPLRAAGGSGVRGQSTKMIDGRNHVYKCLRALGGSSTRGAVLVWHIVGEEVSFHEWGRRNGLNRKSLSLALIYSLDRMAAGVPDYMRAD